ncbi:hydrogenase [Leptospira harrisiae]|uniref:Hydrogenase n=2 Tax=Leptospira harrisiae TaxID=2023189 RepID=A0A2N0AND9_9LEPT|nr:hydrogenase [Leptospira harrisiae]PKA09237.1 hydrogenase [Leptospira harrisiae]
MMKDDSFQKEKKSLWQSYELRGTSRERELQKQEFYKSPDPLIAKIKKGDFDRKTFLKFMGASVVMTTVGCIQKPAEKIVPYVNLTIKNPDGKDVEQYDFVKHGHSYHYASVCGGCSVGCGILVKAKDGRPLKLEGNPNHPISEGALCASGQASIFDLYDADRAKEPQQVVNGTAKSSDWFVLDKDVKEKLNANKGKTIVVTKPLTSPATSEFISEFLKSVGGGKHIEVAFASSDDAITIAQEKSYGKAVLPNYHFDKAKVILSIDSDFLNNTNYHNDFSKRRDLQDKGVKSFNAFIAAETHPSMTGSNADQRVPLKPGDQRKFALVIAKALSDLGVGGGTGVSGINVESSAAELGISKEVVLRTAKALASAKGESLVIAGGSNALTEDAVDLQIAVNMLNSMLGNDGKTIDAGNPLKEGRSNYAENLKTLAKDLKERKAGVVILFGVNPVYQAPNGDEWKKLLHEAAQVVQVSDRVDETALASNWLAPVSHFLESWGDNESVAGIVSVQQPTIRPIFQSKAFEDMLITWAGGSLLGASSLYDYLKAKYSKKTNWEDLLRKGVLVSGNPKADKGGRSFRGTIAPLSPSKKGLTVSLYESTAVGSGERANNSQLQELPDPVSKVTWDNYVAISPQYSRSSGIKLNDVVTVTVGGKSFELPALIQPGLHPEAVGIALGYGRTNVGEIGNGVGKNANILATEVNGTLVYSGLSITLSPTGKKYKLATTQDHHMMSPGVMMGVEWKERPLIISAKLQDYAKNPGAGIPEPEIPKILIDGKLQRAQGANAPSDQPGSQFAYPGYKWGMAVDLTSCSGCGACVVACNIENNVPMVGRDEVRMGREMHWLRIDRYYIGDPEKPESLEIAHQPLMCQHCDNAPCETVCPVAATVHSSEGTNDMVYNRCVGTRYCSNNCPYKVRRFNWLEHWNEHNLLGEATPTFKARPPRNLGLNPDVTVRSRGVMEKCNFCASRVAEKKIAAKNEGRTLRDGEVKAACEQTCSSNSIVFGNVNDPESKVAKLLKDPRSYKLLEYLNIGPAVSYMTRVRNEV